MNREIKFRAWDGKEMEVLPFRGYTDGTLCFPDGEYVDGYFRDYPQPLAVMQYAGLKDKNGVEIYEGDIVRDEQQTHPTVVFYSVDRAAFMLGTRGDQTQYDKHEHLYPENCEVIGNIYENPELLK